MNRRQFLRSTAGAAALLGLGRRAYGYPFSPGLKKWSGPLRGALDMAVAAPDGTRAWPGGVVADHYSIDIAQFTDLLHGDPNSPLKNGTKLWGYGQGGTFRHLGGLIVATRNRPVQLTVTNKLPPTHILPVDVSPFFYDAAGGQNKAAVHLHGGFVPWISDGGPYDWFRPDGTHGPSFLNNQVLAPNNLGGQAEYYYPNQQSARLMWYHDHAHDLTRLNAYAGIATGYVLRDDLENSWIAQDILPSLQNGLEYPLVFQDKIFNGDGSLAYPFVYEVGSDADLAGRWELGDATAPLPTPSVIPEMFGDTMLVNGTVYPLMTVDPRRYRFRVLNACNARFLNLQLYVKDGSADGISIPLDPQGNPLLDAGGSELGPTNQPGPAIVQIGTEGGFLGTSVVLNSPPQPIGFGEITRGRSRKIRVVNRSTLLLAPAERADIVIDFSAFRGKRLVLYTDAPAPFPFGDPRNDYYYGQPNLTSINGSAGPAAGYGPNTRTVLEIEVRSSGGTDSVSFSTWITKMHKALVSRTSELTPLPPAGAVRRRLTINEQFDDEGRLAQLLGTDIVFDGDDYGRPLESASTENVSVDSTEIWEFYNLTGDTHPVHFHLVNVQILDRRRFDEDLWPSVVYLGPPRPPDANETGWKETVRMNPGEVTRVIMQFKLPKVPFTVPSSPRAGANGLGVTPPEGKTLHEYVYHCHILEHEEHDMMRPLCVIG